MWLDHLGIFPVVDRAVHNSVGVVFHAEVRRNGGDLRFPNIRVQFRRRGLPVLAVDMGHRLMELLGEARAGNGRNGILLPSILGVFRCQNA